jgi:hypothetical protein
VKPIFGYEWADDKWEPVVRPGLTDLNGFQYAVSWSELNGAASPDPENVTDVLALFCFVLCFVFFFFSCFPPLVLSSVLFVAAYCNEL